jgi:hypothetical protein
MAITTASSPTLAVRRTRRIVARWMVSFAGFPLGGAAAIILTGPVDSTASAIGGGLVTGVVLGAIQAWAMKADRRLFAVWVLATAVGLAVGLAGGASLTGFSTGLGDLVLQGAASGLAVGLAQAIALLPRIGPIAVCWPIYVSGAWAAGWAVSTSIGIQVEEQFAIFGSTGALVVTLLTSVLPVFLNRRATAAQGSHS